MKPLIKEDFKSSNAWLLPLILGAFAFFIVEGGSILNPENIGWLAVGDPAQHFLGWQFFRNSPWSSPVGLNPANGLDLSNSIVFSDSNPLLAIFFKILSPILPENFQYFGIWLFACYLLQAWFGWKLIGLATHHMLMRLAGAGILVFSPILFFRAPMHLSLSGHFLILAALYLAFLPDLKKRTGKWAILLSVAILVHAYLFAMVGAIWVASLVDALLKRALSPRKLITELAVIFPILALISWQAGYFSVGAGAAGSGFGYFRMNVLSIIDPSHWSYVLPDLPEGGGDYEGFNYLGLGVIVLWGMAIPALLKGKTNSLKVFSEHPMLALILAGLTIFALSNNIGFGSVSVSYPMPEIALKAASILRASGRMFWPVYYCLMLSAVVISIRSYPRPVALACLLTAFFIQIVDTQAGWKSIRQSNDAQAQAAWPSVLTAPFWEKAGTRYKNLKVIMPANMAEHWKTFSHYASANNMSTDAVYLARVGDAESERARQNAWLTLSTGNYDPHTLYIIEEKVLPIASISLNARDDLIALVDGIYVVAPGWKKCADCAVIDNQPDFSSRLAPVAMGEPMKFGSTASGQSNLVAGWNRSEDWGTWSEGRFAYIYLPYHGNASSLHIEANAFLQHKRPTQSLQITVNGIHVKDITLDKNVGNTIDLDLPAAVNAESTNTKYLRIQFRLDDAVSPYELGLSVDQRKLGIGLVSITVN